jgi:histidinol-phosphate aminotransferase
MNGSKTREHGGPDQAGAAPYDFSTNANACGPCPQALAAVQAADATRYPDPTSTHLRARLADFHAVAPERIVIAASASEFIFRVTAWAARRGVRQVELPAHAYGDYAHAAHAFGLAMGRVGCAQRTPATHAAALTWACEPSSPLGGQEPALAQRAAAGGTVVLDRAYEPLRLAGACSLDSAGLQCVWQLWSPNKALALTGVRAAYAIAPLSAEAAAQELEALAPSWPLGAHGVALLQAWCEAPVQQWLEASRATLREWKARQQGLCRELGWEIHMGHANFFVAEAPGLIAALPALRARGIRLRDCASFGLPGQVRLSVQPPAAQEALRRAWHELGASA